MSCRSYLFLFTLLVASATRAETPAIQSGTPPPPYSLPWQLRPAVIGTVIRSDTSVALYKATDAAGDERAGSTVASTLLVSYKVTPSLAPLVRMAFIRNDEPGDLLGSAASFVNPLVGVTYGRKLGNDFRFAAMLAASVPIGQGGDQKRTADATAAATFRGIAARSAMDNAMFAVNYETGIVGADLAWVAHKLTVQAEVTVLQLFRIRHDDIDTDSARTNGTAGLHVGYFPLTWMSLGTELRYQRWLSTPAAVTANATVRDTATFAIGPRFHVKAGGVWLRPGISYARPLDKPLSDGKYNIVQIDLPIVF